MHIDNASEKSIRTPAMDTEDQGLEVFLILASPKYTGQLYASRTTACWPYTAGWRRNKRPEHLPLSLVQHHPMRMTVTMMMSWLPQGLQEASLTKETGRRPARSTQS